ncbi:hypothetical protein F5B22DRAFT_650420 [Xylaria bambusicola]|uniref:uncharacterized protein n=1 Tax=Xylaria bambusicola TaxID=326684 RepID=UPI002007AD88|nr:uncharacterized protein F5B22DRAFT_650420 [Xylaria bambusicola]KAI0506772.1 hypothetical protein F5B22DRAFT_650420 [Xylaria bambusicola]
MSGKSVLSAVCAGNGAFQAAARRVAGQQQRSFTSTPLRNASITHFTPASSPELDRLLSDIRSNIILPSYLPEEQRKKIYSTKWQKRLKADPIVIDIDGEIIKFRYKNPLTDLPNTRKSVMTAITKFKTAADFANLKPLLEGIYYTGRKLQHGNYAKILRVTCAKGHVYDMIDCARSVRRTGYKIDSSEKVNELLHYVQLKARDAEWDEAETRQALRWADMVVEMLYDEAHQPKHPKDQPSLPGEIPLNRDPMVLAAQLHLAAVLASRYEVGEEILDKVHKLAQDIVLLWPEGKKLKELQPAELYQYGGRYAYLVYADKFVSLATPLLHGLETAAKVVKPELASQLQARCDTLRAEIDEARGRVPPYATRHADVYKRFYDA